MKISSLVIPVFLAFLSACAANRNSSSGAAVSESTIRSDSTVSQTAARSSAQWQFLLSQQLDSAAVCLKADSIITPQGVKLYAPKLSCSEWGRGASIQVAAVLTASDTASERAQSSFVLSSAALSNSQLSSEAQAIARPPDLTALAITIIAAVTILLSALLVLYFNRKKKK